MSTTMVRLAEILCPVDLSDTSSHALDHALALARSYNAHLTVMEVRWPGFPPISYLAGASMATPPVLPSPLEELHDELRPFTEHRGTAGVNIDLVVRQGVVVPLILEEARAIGADLIVIGTHGRSGFDRLLLGSVTEDVLRKAHCAVMTVPPADRTATPGRATRSIVCAIDFSPASLKALDYALSLVQELQATLLLVHVFDWPLDGGMPPSVEVETAAYREITQEDSRGQLEALVPAEAHAWCETEALILTGRPHDEIVRLARDRDADLIVMGVHGRSLLNVALFGSTVNQVVRHATCPVVTVPC
jgi:nucleotide-binding universal stress UspA family protein